METAGWRTEAQEGEDEQEPKREKSLEKRYSCSDYKEKRGGRISLNLKRRTDDLYANFKTEIEREKSRAVTCLLGNRL